MILKIVFFGFVALIGVSTLVLLGTRKVLYAAFSLLLILLGISALYVFAGADFLAVTQIIIYVGGILVLLLFGIMLTNRPPQNLSIRFSNPFQQDETSDVQPLTKTRNNLAGIVLGLGLLAILVFAIHKANLGQMPWIKQAVQNQQVIKQSTVQGLGIQLMTQYVLVFEVIAVLLMVALLGAVLIAGRTEKKTG
ncbi:NADH-quinone oxidoreductase subunit J family protein [Microscilla marina]|uniref:NADH-quinone oxidoreductase subunit J n=1 Tax=Microscilla marina ATCC 23134 TaxID=313606 RepID=A1ZJ74_MICM2|nr:NADH-quinone oxidoreductase subunit J [Microscilla marina]EAY29610.1 NADH-ubiquinone/plastoquinone oxidoreductase chain 6 superfamily [Microscilla marina ATCC 23134]